MIAAWVPALASLRAAMGSSQAPGRRTTSTASSGTPLSARLRRAPATRASVMRAFQRLARIAKRAPAGTRRSPSYRVMVRGSSGVAQFTGHGRPGPRAAALALGGQVLDDFQAVAGQVHLAARGAKHAQPAQAEVGQDLGAGAVAPPLAHVPGIAAGLRLG